MSDPVERWLAALAEYLDATVEPREAGWVIAGNSIAWNRFFEGIAVHGESNHPLFIATKPEGPQQWLDHLRIVERAAAQQITSAPVAFKATVQPALRMRGVKTVVRLAFGLSLSLGNSLRQRFTATVTAGETRATLTAGDDGLFDLAPEITTPDLNRQDLHHALPALLSAVVDAETVYRRDAGVIAELDRLREAYVDEFQSLASIYTINSGRDARLLGMESQERKGEDAIEGEYVARLEDLENRYRPGIRLDVLTIGVVEGWLPVALQ